MPVNKLLKLTLTSFRGATQTTSIDFDSKKKITMIFGENGTGKSSIVDAFSFIGEQNLGSLEGLSGADKSCITSINGNVRDLYVQLVTEQGAWEGRLGGRNKPVVTPPTGCPPFRILRRSQILKLINAAPSERFKELGGYIDVSMIEKCENALRKAKKDVDDEQPNNIRAFQNSERSLNQLWMDAGKIGDNAVNWAKDEVQKDLTVVNSQLTAIDSIVNLISVIEQRYKDLQIAQTQYANSKNEYDQANAVKQLEEQKVVGQSSLLVQLLQQAKAYIDEEGRTSKECPICKKPIDAKQLSSDLQQRITNMTGLAQAIKTAEIKERAFKNAEGQFQNIESQILTIIESLNKEVAVTIVESIPKDTLKESISEILKADISINDRMESAKRLLTIFGEIKPGLNQLRQSLQQTVSLQKTIEGQLKEYNNCSSKIQTADALGKRLTEALNIVEQTRKNFVSQILKEISLEVQRLYDKIHPDEGVGGIRLSLDEQYIGSLHLHGNFFNRVDITPQSVFSESHLDTLGFCVFLALAKREANENTVIVLDDILTSVDARHLDRYIELLHEESEHFNHIIITTHYRPWFERYRNNRAPMGQVHFIELCPWNLTSGLGSRKPKLDLEVLSQALSPDNFDRQTVASKCGIFLENILDFLAKTYGCRVRYMSQLTLSELADCFPKRLLQHMRIERDEIVKDATGTELSHTKTIQLEPILTKIKTLTILRNYVGAHFNEKGSEVTDAEIEELGKVTLELGQALICPESGDLPCKDKTGECWQSRNGKVRLYPHGMPS